MDGRTKSCPTKTMLSKKRRGSGSRTLTDDLSRFQELLFYSNISMCCSFIATINKMLQKTTKNELAKTQNGGKVSDAHFTAHKFSLLYKMSNPLCKHSC